MFKMHTEMRPVCTSGGRSRIAQKNSCLSQPLLDPSFYSGTFLPRGCSPVSFRGPQFNRDRLLVPQCQYAQINKTNQSTAIGFGFTVSFGVVGQLRCASQDDIRG